MSKDPSFYIWTNEKFYRLDEDDKASFAGDSVWIPYTPYADEPYCDYFDNDEVPPWQDGDNELEYYYIMMQRAKYGDHDEYHPEPGFYDGLEQALALQEKELILDDG